MNQTATPGDHLQHHFADAAQQRESSKFGMWVFLLTEVLFFGGLFTGYTIYRVLYTGAWVRSSHRLYLSIGAINTGILLLSSLTMALAVHASSELRRRRQMVLLLATAFLGSCFLGLKGFEYYLDWSERLVPGAGFAPEGVVEIGREQMFYVLYFLMTGLHAIHLLVGVGVVITLAFLVSRTPALEAYRTKVEMSGLYWHFIDVVWVFLFPLLYMLE